MSATVPEISVVIPTYCEETAIRATVEAVHRHLSRSNRAFEIIVVDNASTDGTVASLQEARLAEVTVLVNSCNRGKGYSVTRGMLQASGSMRLHCDADCAPSLVSLGAMEDALREGADVVVGSRLAPGARIGQRQPLLRRMMGSTFQWLCRFILGDPTRDRFCGFKLWTADAAERVFPYLSLDGWTFDAEALALARRLGLRVDEQGITWSDREGSRLSMLRVLVPVTRELLIARKSIRSAARASLDDRDRG